MFFIAQLLPVPQKWTAEEVHAFWREHQSIVVTRRDNIQQCQQRFARDEQCQCNQAQSELDDFYMNEEQHWFEPSAETLAILHTAENLIFWAENRHGPTVTLVISYSWRRCSQTMPTDHQQDTRKTVPVLLTGISFQSMHQYLPHC